MRLQVTDTDLPPACPALGLVGDQFTPSALPHTDQRLIATAKGINGTAEDPVRKYTTLTRPWITPEPDDCDMFGASQLNATKGSGCPQN